jgi:histidinol-phosphate aminotransferase
VTLVPPYIETLAPYQPGKPVEELERELGITGAIKLASNENPLGPSPKALAAVQAALADVNRYPDGAAWQLRRGLAARHGVKPEELVFGAGSNELIDLLVRVFCRPGVDEALTHRYAFMMYRVSCQAHGVTLREADTTAELACDVDALADAISPATKLIFLPNPNNPTGSYVPRAAFERFLARVPADVILVADEAYYEYARALPDYPVAEEYRAQHPLLISLRTFSKAYGLASMRVGYGIADARVCAYIDRVRMPFNLGTPAQVAALAALDDQGHVDRSVASNAEGKALLTDGIAKLGAKVYPSATNFVLVDVGRDAARVYEGLLRKGVIVRPLKPLGLTRHLRISIGTLAENQRALAALGEVLGA